MDSFLFGLFFCLFPLSIFLCSLRDADNRHGLLVAARRMCFCLLAYIVTQNTSIYFGVLAWNSVSTGIYLVQTIRNTSSDELDRRPEAKQRALSVTFCLLPSVFCPLPVSRFHHTSSQNLRDTLVSIAMVDFPSDSPTAVLSLSGSPVCARLQLRGDCDGGVPRADDVLVHVGGHLQSPWREQGRGRRRQELNAFSTPAVQTGLVCARNR